VRRYLLLTVKVAVTLLTVVLAVLIGRWLWVRYELQPWTRDGRVRADVALISPDVTGFVTSVRVEDDQPVKRGDILFTLDQDRYRIALAQARAAVLNDEATLAEASREMDRDRLLGPLVATESTEQSQTRLLQARAGLAQATANLDAAALNLRRSIVHAPVDGVVTNVELRPGDYLTAGRQALALVDSATLHVDGYFEETKLPRIHVGDPVAVTLMGEKAEIRGHVQSIAAAILDRERSFSPNLVADINPTFSWVRLAQRVPVRIRLDQTPSGLRLIAGRTATVVVLNPHAVSSMGGRPWWRIDL
jgi:multidrug resistance efflux pump